MVIDAIQRPSVRRTIVPSLFPRFFAIVSCLLGPLCSGIPERGPYPWYAHGCHASACSFGCKRRNTSKAPRLYKQTQIKAPSLAYTAQYLVRSSVAERYNSFTRKYRYNMVAHLPLEHPAETLDPVPAR